MSITTLISQSSCYQISAYKDHKKPVLVFPDSLGNSQQLCLPPVSAQKPPPSVPVFSEHSVTLLGKYHHAKYPGTRQESDSRLLISLHHWITILAD